MLLFLNGANSDKDHPNENYAREVMELFTLGADRGAYTENDVRELARALTGWRADYVDEVGWTNFRYDPGSHDNRQQDGLRPHRQLRLAGRRATCASSNPYHRSFFVLKLWSYFIPTPPDAATQAALEKLYVDSDWSIRAVRRGDPAPPGAVHRRRRWSSRRSSTAPACCARSASGRRSPRCMWLERRTPASGSSTRRTSRAGTTTRWLDTSTLCGRWRLVYDVLEDDDAAERRHLRPDRDRRARRSPGRWPSGATRRCAPRRRRAARRSRRQPSPATGDRQHARRNRARSARTRCAT